MLNEELLERAENGGPLARLMVGAMYYLGEGTEQDYKEAFNWYLKAAENGIPSAKVEVATRYEIGLGVDRDSKKASIWLKRSLEEVIKEISNSL